MLKRLRDAHLIAPLIATLIGIAFLAGLGKWQLDRKAWKEGLIAAIETRTHAPPVTLEEAMRRWKAGEDVEYLRVKAEGRFEHANELYLYAPSADDGPGYDVYTPMIAFGTKREAGKAPELTTTTLIVNRGYVPEAKKEPATRAEGQINDQPITIPAESYHQGSIKGATVVGLLRKSATKGYFTPANDLKANLWFWRDLDAMVAAVLPGECKEKGAAEMACARPHYPFFLDLEKADIPGGWPRGGATIIDLPNRHLEYALTWFGLAATLAGVFLAFAAGRLRRDSGAGS